MKRMKTVFKIFGWCIAASMLIWALWYIGSPENSIKLDTWWIAKDHPVRFK